MQILKDVFTGSGRLRANVRKAIENGSLVIVPSGELEKRHIPTGTGEWTVETAYIERGALVAEGRSPEGTKWKLVHRKPYDKPKVVYGARLADVEQLVVQYLRDHWSELKIKPEWNLDN